MNRVALVEVGLAVRAHPKKGRPTRQPATASRSTPWLDGYWTSLSSSGVSTQVSRSARATNFLYQSFSGFFAA